MKETISSFLKMGYLLSPDTVKLFKETDTKEIVSLVSKKIKQKNELLVFSEDLINLVKSEEEKLDINWLEFERSRSMVEKGKDFKVYNMFLDILNYNISEKKKNKLKNFL